MDKPLRLQVFLARCNIGSRRKCEEIIAQGRVRLNGRVIKTQGEKVEDGDVVEVDSRIVHLTKKMVYIAFNKPEKVISSASDPQGRPVAVDYLKNVFPMRLYNVGRLDFLSSGLLLFTNDGEFSKKVQHPSSQIEKEYLVETKKPIDKELLLEFTNGVMIEGVQYRINKFNINGPRSVSLVLEEGKNREIRKLFTSRNIAVKRLHRIRIGPVKLKGLAPGQFRPLTQKEIQTLTNTGN